VKIPLLPSCTAYTRDHGGKRHRRFASPENGPESAGVVQELKIAPHHHRIESKQARGESEDGLLAIPLGGFQLQVFTAFLEGGFNRPPLCVTLDHWLRLHGDVRGEALLVTVSPGAIMDV
jgi:hypothetical protein